MCRSSPYSTMTAWPWSYNVLSGIESRDISLMVSKRGEERSHSNSCPATDLIIAPIASFEVSLRDSIPGML